jgi:hypothetical protein
MSSTYTNAYGNTYKSVTCYKYNGSSSYTCIAPGEINLYNRTDKSGYSFEEKLLTFNGWSTTADNTADYAVGAKISITANTTFYSATSLKDKYYSNSIFGADLGTGVLYTLSSSSAYKEGVDLGHRMKATGWKYYTGRTGCTNYVWLYGYSLDETWSQYGYACSYYMGLQKLSAA